MAHNVTPTTPMNYTNACSMDFVSGKAERGLGYATVFIYMAT